MATAQMATLDYSVATDINQLVALWKSDPNVEVVLEPAERGPEYDTLTETFRWSMRGFVEERAMWQPALVLLASRPMAGDTSLNWRNYCPLDMTEGGIKFRIKRWEAVPAPHGCSGWLQPGMEAVVSCTTKVVSDLETGEVLSFETTRATVKALGPIRPTDACEGGKG